MEPANSTVGAISTKTVEENNEEIFTEESSSPTEKDNEKFPNVAGKVDILFKATGNAPILKRKKWKVEMDRSMGSISYFLRKYLKLTPTESLFLYVNQAFAPAPDQTIKNLYECYAAEGTLVIHYCKSQAWG